jgi:Ca2+-binding EF-hand superfamily protein
MFGLPTRHHLSKGFRRLALVMLATGWLLAAGGTVPAADDPHSETRQAVADKFKSLDADGDGVLNDAELAGMIGDKPRVERVLRLFDRNNDHRLNYEEYLTVPGLVAAQLRGPFPDPLAKLVQRELAGMDEKWAGWDKNGDKVLSRDEFQASPLPRRFVGTIFTTFKEWDRDRDGSISRDDCRQLLEIAFGIRRLTGEPTRFESGVEINVMLFGYIDENRDNRLDHDEFLKNSFERDQAEARFLLTDADHDGVITYSEWSAMADRYIDPIATFLSIDGDFDGRLSKTELLKGTPDWQQSVARHVFPGFDLDRDGFLSLDEYRLAPPANKIVRWHEPLEDRDGDGLLRLSEFHWERVPWPLALEAEYFKLLDLNQDGRLDLDEFSFNTPRRDLNRDFRKYDANGDGALGDGELAAAVGDKPRAGRLLKLFDRDGDRRIKYEEFLTVPGLVPMQKRGPLPDPIVKLVDAQATAIDEKWKEWDKNADGALSPEEFQSSDLARLVPGLNPSAWQDWDRDADGAVSRADCRRLLEIAFGVRRPTGESLRFPSGITVNAMLFGYADQNRDDRLDHDEFVRNTFQGENAEALFRETDPDRDNLVTFAEWSKVDTWLIDPIAEFLRIDADFDGQLNKEEFLKGTPDWQQQIARHIFPGFDLDGNGFLSLDEYRRIPLANFFTMWHEPRRDSDNDGKLSPIEFQWRRRPELACLEAEYFRSFDLNRDGFLDLTEFFFQTAAGGSCREN